MTDKNKYKKVTNDKDHIFFPVIFFKGVQNTKNLHDIELKVYDFLIILYKFGRI